MGIVEVLYFAYLVFHLLLCDFCHCFAIENEIIIHMRKNGGSLIFYYDHARQFASVREMVENSEDFSSAVVDLLAAVEVEASVVGGGSRRWSELVEAGNRIENL